ncbi:PspC domain-containing protein [Candidatus Aminicenantes bacterium AC-334-K16]|jgi:phage shock protein C|nr:PspC domain-containing protein [Candidatus Aminicenantes bacterium AC-334-K16]
MAKKLFRSQKDKMLGGVCAGLAAYLDIDTSLVRLIFIALSLLTALLPMILFYIIAWIIVPAEPLEQPTPKTD